VPSEAGHTSASVLTASPDGHGSPTHVSMTVCEAIGASSGGAPASGVPASGVPSGVLASGIPPSAIPPSGVPAGSGGVTPADDPQPVCATTHEIQRRADHVPQP